MDTKLNNWKILHGGGYSNSVQRKLEERHFIKITARGALYISRYSHNTMGEPNYYRVMQSPDGTQLALLGEVNTTGTNYKTLFSADAGQRPGPKQNPRLSVSSVIRRTPFFHEGFDVEYSAYINDDGVLIANVRSPVQLKVHIIEKK